MRASERSCTQLFEALEQTAEYWRQDAILDFAEELHHMMEERGVSRAELARRIGKSPAYVTQVLRADSNFTIGTMTKLGMALGCRLRLHLAPMHSTTTWTDLPYSPEAISNEPGEDV